MGRYKNSKLFNGTKGNRQMSLEQGTYDELLSNLSKHINSNSINVDKARPINVNKQNKHINGSKEYIPGKSEITISLEECEKLGKMFYESGENINNNKERVDFGKVIGNYVDENNNSIPTTVGIIHKSKTGFHIVPAKPKGGKK